MELRKRIKKSNQYAIKYKGKVFPGPTYGEILERLPDEASTDRKTLLGFIDEKGRFRTQTEQAADEGAVGLPLPANTSHDFDDGDRVHEVLVSGRQAFSDHKGDLEQFGMDKSKIKHLYHGTTENNLNNIKKEGLNRRLDPNDDWSGNFVSTDPQHAYEMGKEMRTRHKGKGKTVVLKIDRTHPSIKGAKLDYGTGGAMERGPELKNIIRYPKEYNSFRLNYVHPKAIVDVLKNKQQIKKESANKSRRAQDIDNPVEQMRRTAERHGFKYQGIKTYIKPSFNDRKSERSTQTKGYHIYHRDGHTLEIAAKTTHHTPKEWWHFKPHTELKQTFGGYGKDHESLHAHLTNLSRPATYAEAHATAKSHIWLMKGYFDNKMFRPALHHVPTGKTITHPKAATHWSPELWNQVPEEHQSTVHVDDEKGPVKTGWADKAGKFYSRKEASDAVRQISGNVPAVARYGDYLESIRYGADPTAKAFADFQPKEDRRSDLAQKTYRSFAVKYHGHVMEALPHENSHFDIVKRRLSHLMPSRSGGSWGGQHQYDRIKHPDDILHGYVTHQGKFHSRFDALRHLVKQGSRTPQDELDSFRMESKKSFKGLFLLRKAENAFSREWKNKQFAPALRHRRTGKVYSHPDAYTHYSDPLLNQVESEGHDLRDVEAGWVNRAGEWHTREQAALKVGGKHIGGQKDSVASYPYLETNSYRDDEHAKSWKNREFSPALKHRNKIYTHPNAQTHTDVYNTLPESVQNTSEPIENGFVNREGKWHTRKEAAAKLPDYEDISRKLWGNSIEEPEHKELETDTYRMYLGAPARKSHNLHYRTQFPNLGMKISIENQRGSWRKWKQDGSHGWCKMLVPYGYFPGTKSLDGQAVDCFIGPDKDAENAYVITNMRGKHFNKIKDQKVMIGFSSPEEAKAMFLAHYKDHRHFGSMREIPIRELKGKLLDTATNRTGLIY